MEIYYLNSNSKRIDLNVSNFHMLGDTSIFNNEWDVITKGINNLKVANFTKNLVESEFSLLIKGKDKKNYYENVNHLLEVFEEDIYNIKTGRLYFDDWFLECFVIATSRPEKYLERSSSVSTFKIVSETGMWTKEDTFLYRRANKVDSTYLDYPYDYKYDYQNEFNKSFINNKSYRPSDFELVIYGSCVNPAISINENTYIFNISLSKDEYLIVNSVDKTIKKYSNGEFFNEFNSRSRDFYVFTPIPTGRADVAWENDFDFDITLLQQRNEPLWT